jgi:inosine triphosphate pyrophosphatase
MEKSEKNKISHRAKALEKLKEWLAEKKEDA